MNPYLPRYLKGKNRKIIFELLRERGQMSRTEIARVTGISLPTVLKATDRLLELEILEETEETDHQEGAGRKGHLLRFNPDKYIAAGIEFEGNLAHLGLVNLSGECIVSRTVRLPSLNAKPDLDKLSPALDELLNTDEAGNATVMGVGIGFPAVINPESSSVMRLPSFGIWEETPFEKLFPKFCSAVKLPYFWENDVNLACVGEAFLRQKSENCENLLYLSLDAGLGAGIFLNGKLWRGMNFKSGEIGDIIVAPSALPSHPSPSVSGFENLINLDAISRRFNVNFLRAEEISPELTKEICEYIVPHLSLMLYNLTNILDIKPCVLTGTIPRMLGEPLLEQLRKSLAAAMLTEDKISIEPARNYSGLTGAAVTVFDHCFKNVLED